MLIIIYIYYVHTIIYYIFLIYIIYSLFIYSLFICSLFILNIPYLCPKTQKMVKIGHISERVFGLNDFSQIASPPSFFTIFQETFWIDFKDSSLI